MRRLTPWLIAAAVWFPTSGRADPTGPGAPAASRPAKARPADAKPTDARPTNAKPTDAKPTDAKPADAKPTEAKPADAKPTDGKPAAATKPATAPSPADAAKLAPAPAPRPSGPVRRVELTPSKLFAPGGALAGSKLKTKEERRGMTMGDDRDWKVQAAQVGAMVGIFAGLAALCGGGDCMLPTADFLPDFLKSKEGSGAGIPAEGNLRHAQ